MFTTVKMFKFEAAHYLKNHRGQCRHIHGHSYKVHVALQSEYLVTQCPSAEGMVMDFSTLKEQFQPKIDEWDHTLLVEYASDVHGIDTGQWGTYGHKIVELGFRPTAENMARHLFDVVDTILYHLRQELHPEVVRRNVSVAWVRVYETDTSYAEFSL